MRPIAAIASSVWPPRCGVTARRGARAADGRAPAARRPGRRGRAGERAVVERRGHAASSTSSPRAVLTSSAPGCTREELAVDDAARVGRRGACSDSTSRARQLARATGEADAGRAVDDGSCASTVAPTPRSAARRARRSRPSPSRPTVARAQLAARSDGPAAGAHRAVGRDQRPAQREHERQRQLGDRRGVGPRRGGHVDAVRAAAAQVDAVDADAVARHDAQRGAAAKTRRRSRRGRPGARRRRRAARAARPRPAGARGRCSGPRAPRPRARDASGSAPRNERGVTSTRAVTAQGSITTLSASPERAASKAAPASASGRRSATSAPVSTLPESTSSRASRQSSVVLAVVPVTTSSL